LVESNGCGCLPAISLAGQPAVRQAGVGQARPPRLSESDPPAIARHERAGGGQAKYLLAYKQGQRKKGNSER